MYFRLNPECYFIRGRRCGVILDLIDEIMYLLNPEETEIVTSSENNCPITCNEEIFSELKRLRLGNFYYNKVYIQKLRIGSLSEEMEKGSPPQLNRAFLEINNSCNRNCWFCGYNGISRSLGCMGCNKWKEDGEALTIRRWMQLIDELNCLECRDVIITGGDLTLTWDRTAEILDYAKGKFANIYVILHEQSLSENIINNFANKTKMIIQTENVNNRSDIYSTLLTVTPKKWEYIQDELYEHTLIDFVINNEHSLKDSLPIMSKEKILPIDIYKLSNNVEYHPCLGHTLAISYTGNVIPCPMMRDHCLGNIVDKGLYTIFRDGMNYIEKFWKLNLNKIETCTECEFRYVCSDCRALEERLTGNINGKLICSYNPEEGKWA